ncbi:cytochrome P450 71A1-like [Aristolochia californica]|uniref:cytochrome P450 71A1-like n=1 Tax=Aristolochia californica TaxID=171875 RepID=UPI0035DA483B
MVVSVFFLFLLLLLPAFLLFKRNSRGKSLCRLPPGPFRLPIIGNLHQLREVTHRSLWSLSQQYGSLMFLKLGRRSVVVASSAAMAREVMKSHDLQFCSRPSFVSQTKLSYNNRDVAFAPYGPQWREMRKIAILELFSVKRVQSFSSIRYEEIAEMIHKIARSGSSPQKAVDLSELLLTFSNNIVLKAAFGKSYQGGDEQQRTKLHDAVNEERILLTAFFFTDYLPQLAWVDVLTGLNGRLQKNFAELDSFYEKVMEEHLDPKRPTPEQEDLVDVLLRLQREQNLGRDYIKGTLMNVLIGGTDSSSSTVDWAMTELLRNPTAIKKAQREVRTVVQGKQQVEETDLHKLEFLNAVIKETLRLHAPAPLLLHRETMDYCKIAGYDISPETIVIVNAFAIGQDPESWQNPEEFMPERFENSSVDYKGQDFELVPFGAGRRVCPGLYFGIMNAKLALANLLFCFDWELPEVTRREEIDMNESYGLVVQRRTPLRLVPIKYDTGPKESES